MKYYYYYINEPYCYRIGGSKYNVIVDFTGFSFYRNYDRKVEGIVTKTSRYYPGRVEKIFVVNPPNMFHIISRGYTTMGRFKEAERMVLLKKKHTVRAILLRFFLPEQLPVQYGGTRTDVFSVFQLKAMKYTDDDAKEQQDVEEYEEGEGVKKILQQLALVVEQRNLQKKNKNQHTQSSEPRQHATTFTDLKQKSTHIPTPVCPPNDAVVPSHTKEKAREKEKEREDEDEERQHSPRKKSSTSKHSKDKEGQKKGKSAESSGKKKSQDHKQVQRASSLPLVDHSQHPTLQRFNTSKRLEITKNIFKDTTEVVLFI